MARSRSGPIQVASSQNRFPGWRRQPSARNEGRRLHPWDPAAYVVVDLPEAIFSNIGLGFWRIRISRPSGTQNKAIPNRDWQRPGSGSLISRWELPNGIVFGVSLTGKASHVEMELFLTNGTGQELTQLRTQICVLLKGAPDFNQQAETNKLWRNPVAAVSSSQRDRWILTSWERCGRVWGNPAVPACTPTRFCRTAHQDKQCACVDGFGSTRGRRSKMRLPDRKATDADSKLAASAAALLFRANKSAVREPYVFPATHSSCFGRFRSIVNSAVRTCR